MRPHASSQSLAAVPWGTASGDSPRLPSPASGAPPSAGLRATGMPGCYPIWEGWAGQGLPARKQRIAFADFPDSPRTRLRLANGDFRRQALPRADSRPHGVTAVLRHAAKVDSNALRSCRAIRLLGKGYPLFPTAQKPPEGPPNVPSRLQSRRKIYGAALPTKRIDPISPGSF
ncbi:hypothetical protein D9M68_845370 [compost metagenome]